MISAVQQLTEWVDRYYMPLDSDGYKCSKQNLIFNRIQK